MVPSGVPAGRRVPSATSAGLTVPRTGETTTRQSEPVLGLGAAALGRDELAGAVEVGLGPVRARISMSGALPLALGQPGQRAGRRQLEDGGDAELAHRGQARVEAHRAGDLADQPGKRLGARVDGRAVGVGEQQPAGLGRRRPPTRPSSSSRAEAM